MGASLHVFTYKDGLLARLAHDLRLTLTRFEVELEAGVVQARFDLGSLRVDGVLRDGKLDPDALSGRDREQILEHAQVDVLQTELHPEARFEGRLTGAAEAAPGVEGTLSLRGRPVSQAVELELGEAEAVVRGRLVPSRWGIRPFKALAGAIKLQDVIDVELRLPREGGATGQPWGALRQRWRAGS